MDCRPGCGACCIAPSISSPIPGMPQGKPGGVRCSQLNDENFCKIFGQADRPQICRSFSASEDTCGESNKAALQNLTELEKITQ